MIEEINQLIDQLKIDFECDDSFSAINLSLIDRFKHFILETLEKTQSQSIEGVDDKTIADWFYKTIFYIETEDKVYVIQLQCQEGIKHSLNLSTNTVTFYKENKSLHIDIDKVQLHLCAVLDKKKEKIKEIKTLLATYGMVIFECDLVKKGDQEEYEKIFMAHFDLVKESFTNHGSFILPEKVIQVLREKTSGKNEEAFKALYEVNQMQVKNTVSLKNIFSNPLYSYFSTKFTELKIKEIAYYLAEGKLEKPVSAICISMLIVSEEGNGEACIVSATLTDFDAKTNLTTSIEIETYKGNIVSCLMFGRWHENTLDKTILRISNIPLSHQLEVNIIFGPIQYALLSSEIKKRKNSKEYENTRRSFWEELAIIDQSKTLSEQCELSKNIFEKSFSGIPDEKDIILNNVTTTLTRDDPEKGYYQSENIKRVLRNQQANLGSLLHLPTAYGKTYVMLLAIYEHTLRNNENEDLHFLIVGPKSVFTVWQKCADQLEKRSGGKILFNLELNEGSQKTSLNTFVSNKPTLHFVTADDMPRNIKEALTFQSKKEEESNEEEMGVESEIKRKVQGKKKDIIRDELSIYQGHEYYLVERFLKIIGIFRKPNTTQENAIVLFGVQETWKKDFEELCAKGKNIKEKIHVIFKNKKVSIDYFNGKNEDDFFQSELNQESLDALKLKQKKKDDESKKELYHYICGLLFLTKDGELQRIQDMLGRIGKHRNEKIDAFFRERHQYSGVLLDESDLVLRNSIKSKSNLLIFSLALECVLRSTSKSLPTQHPLLVASSATPWPNDITEFRDHCLFLMPALNKEFPTLLDLFVKHWKKANNFFEDHRVENPTRENSAKFHRIALPVANDFFEWKRFIFEKMLVSNVQSGTMKSNQSSQSFLKITQISYDKDIKDRIGKLDFVPDFYASCLNGSKNGSQTSDMLQRFFDKIEELSAFSKKSKIAIYVDRYQSAELITSKVASKNPHIITGKFFAEKEFKSDGNGRDKQLEQFNNIVSIAGIVEFILYQFDQPEKSKLFSSVKLQLSNLENYFELPRTSKAKKRGRPSASREKEILKHILGSSSDFKKDIWLDNTDSFKDFFLALKMLVNKSHERIIPDMAEEIDSLWEIVRLRFQEPTWQACVEKFNSNHLPNKVTDFHSLFSILCFSVLSYLERITRSNLLIYGIAGASGISINADLLFIFSGAWTEGRLSQVKGRVGRLMPNGSFRHCQIFLPMTNTIVEFYILETYAYKALLNNFLTGRNTYSEFMLLQELLIAAQLERIRKIRGEINFIDDRVFEIIQDESKANTYINAEPIEKAAEMVRFFGPESLTILETWKNLFSQEAHPHLSQQKTYTNSKELPITTVDKSFLPETIHQRILSKEALPSQPQPELWSKNKAFLSDEFKNQLDSFVKALDPSTAIFLVTLPTRGVNPDIGYKRFIESYEHAAKQNPLVKFILLYGINNSITELDQTAEIRLIKRLIECHPSYFLLENEEENKALLSSIQYPESNYHPAFFNGLLKEACRGIPSIEVYRPLTLLDLKNLNTQKELIKAIKNTDRYCFIPLQVTGDFWVCLISDKKSEILFYLDPRGHKHPAPQEVYDLYTHKDLHFAEMLYQNKFEFSVAHIVQYSGIIAAEIFIYFVMEIALVEIEKKTSVKTYDRYFKKFMLALIKKSSNECLSLRAQHIDDFSNHLLFSIDHQGNNDLSVLFKPFIFGWYDKDKKNSSPIGLPPIGEMRRHCLEQAQSVYRYLKEKNPNLLIQYCSTDGDTLPTPEHITYVLSSTQHQETLSAMTAGYEAVLDVEPDLSSMLVKLFIRFSMNVYSQLTSYFGYFSEPFIALSARLTTLLFEQRLTADAHADEASACYGHWDLEGRRFLNYLRKLVKDQAMYGEMKILGPSSNVVARPRLENVERFKLRDDSLPVSENDLRNIFSHIMQIPDSMIPLILPKAILENVIQKMCSQSLNCIDPHYMGRNIAVFSATAVGWVRKLSSYFYLKAMLHSLQLGPFRSFQLIRALYDHFSNRKNIEDTLQDETWLSYFIENNLSREELKNFIHRIFITEFSVSSKAALNGTAQGKHESVLLMILEWALAASYELMRMFGQTYEGELDVVDTLAKCKIPIELPAEYPKNANKMAEQDSKDHHDEFDEDVSKNVDESIAPPLPTSSDLSVVQAQIIKENIDILSEKMNSIVSFFKEKYQLDGWEFRPKKSTSDYQKFIFGKSGNRRTFFIIKASSNINHALLHEKITEDKKFDKLCIITVSNDHIEIENDHFKDDSIINEYERMLGKHPAVMAAPNESPPKKQKTVTEIVDLSADDESTRTLPSKETSGNTASTGLTGTASMFPATKKPKTSSAGAASFSNTR